MHSHSHGRGLDSSRMAWALAINAGMLAAAIAGWLLFDSVALLGEFGHILSDVVAIVVALGAARIATRPAQGRRTFGFQRGEVLAALVNGLTLLVLAAVILAESIPRLTNPPAVDGAGVLAIGFVELLGNGAATLVLAGGDRSNLNLEAVLRHSAADALGALGVVLAGAVVVTTGWGYADPIAGIAIAVLIVLGSWRLIREPFDVLMEAAPAGIQVDEVGSAMVSVEGVREVHDLHIWTVTSGFAALSAHVRIGPHEDLDAVREEVEQVLRERFGLEHTTLQVMAEQLLELEDRRPAG